MQKNAFCKLRKNISCFLFTKIYYVSNYVEITHNTRGARNFNIEVRAIEMQAIKVRGIEMRVVNCKQL